MGGHNWVPNYCREVKVSQSDVGLIGVKISCPAILGIWVKSVSQKKDVFKF